VSLATQVLLALGLGLATGIFFGEAAGALQIVGDAFIRLLRMTVMPFIAVSLLSAVGKLEASAARDLALRGGAALLLVWAIMLAVVAAMPLAFPAVEAASFFSTSMVAERVPFDFLELYIPANPIYSLSHDFVPALVLFSIVLGIALINVEEKDGLIRGLDSLLAALSIVTGWVARLAPIGVFALIGSAAGTTAVEELQRLQVYVVVYILLSLLLSLWVLPGLVAALTPLGWRDIVPPIRDAIVTAFATANLLIVIPILTTETGRIAGAKASNPREARTAVDVIVPASFNFPSAGKLLSLGFLPFAGWFVGSSISLQDYPQFLVTGLFMFFGATVIAIPSMLDVLRLPADLFEVFITIDVITSRFQVLLATMSTVCLALLGAFAMSGSLRVQPLRLARFAAISVAAIAAVLIGTRVFYSYMLQGSSTYQSFVAMQLEDDRKITAELITEEPPVPSEPFEGSRLDRIHEDQLLRVCYFSDSLPFAFVNAQNHLVGFDVAMAHELAKELQVELAFIRVERAQLAGHLNGGTCDIAMSGFAVTPERTREHRMSVPYRRLTLAFAVPDHHRRNFSTWEQIGERAVNLGVPDVPYFVELIRRRLPNAELTPVSSARPFFRGEVPEVDALVTAAESASAWTLIYPSYTIVVPEPGRIKVPAAYPMPHGADDLVRYVDAWILLEESSGTIEQLFDLWILGQASKDREPRWSVLHNVLHWGEEKAEVPPAPPESDPDTGSGPVPDPTGEG